MFRFLPLLIVAAVWGGCVVSVDHVVPETDAMFDSDLLGTWQDDSKDHAVVKRADSLKYAIDYTSGGDDVRFEAYLGQLGDIQVLDVWPTPAEGDLPEPFVHMLIPGHLLLAVDITPDSLLLAPLDPDSLHAQLITGGVGLTFTEARDQLILHGTTDGLRAELGTFLEHPDWLEEATTWHRVQE